MQSRRACPELIERGRLKIHDEPIVVAIFPDPPPRLYHSKDFVPLLLPAAFCEEAMRTSLLVTGSVAAALLLLSCNRPKPYEAGAPGGPHDPDLVVRAGGYHGNHFRGPVYIPRASPMVNGTTVYNVTYQDGVTVLGKDETMRHLVNIQRDGTYAFDASATRIANLEPGAVLLLSGLALCTVVSVERTGDRYLLKTAPAKITDAIKEGRLEGVYKIDFSKMLGRGVADFDVDFGGYNYHVKFTPGKDRIDIQAIIKFAGSQGALAYEGVGYLSNFISTLRMQIKDGQLTNLGFTNSALSGQVELKWFAVANDAMKAGPVAKITSWPAELLKSAPLSRAAYHVPILLGAVPFDLKISLGFSFIPAFTSKNSVVEGSKLIQYSGSGGFVLANGQTRPSGSLKVQADVNQHDTRVVAAGPVGFTAATEAPRVDLALGWPPTALPVAGYLNFVTSYGIVTNGMASPAPCQTNIMAFSVNAGPAYTSPDTFATWLPMGGSPVPLWQKTLKSAGAAGRMCPG